MFQITIDYNCAHIMRTEPIRTVDNRDEANEFARHLASNMTFALSTDRFSDGFSDADPFSDTLTDYEKSVLYSVFLAKPDDFWFHVIDDQTGELVNAEQHDTDCSPEPDDEPEMNLESSATFICDFSASPELADAVKIWLNNHRATPNHRFELFFHDCAKQDALTGCLDMYEIDYVQFNHRVTMFPKNDREIAQVMDFLNRH